MCRLCHKADKLKEIESIWWPDKSRQLTGMITQLLTSSLTGKSRSKCRLSFLKKKKSKQKVVLFFRPIAIVGITKQQWRMLKIIENGDYNLSKISFYTHAYFLIGTERMVMIMRWWRNDKIVGVKCKSVIVGANVYDKKRHDGCVR